MDGEEKDDEVLIRERVRGEREALLQRIQTGLERPMLLLAFVWLALFVMEAVWGISPVLVALNYAIWAVFVLELLLAMLLAPDRSRYVRVNWLKVIAVVAPFLRIARVASVLRISRLARASQAVRGLRLLRVLSSINRGMGALASTMQRRGFGYVLLLTLIVTVTGAAGMYSFEADNGTLRSYGEALWWTAMIMTTMGSEAWPRTPEGRILCLLLATYAFAVFGYVTAVLASYFIGRDVAPDRHEAMEQSLLALRAEVQTLRQILERCERDAPESGR